MCMCVGAKPAPIEIRIYKCLIYCFSFSCVFLSSSHIHSLFHLIFQSIIFFSFSQNLTILEGNKKFKKITQIQNDLFFYIFNIFIIILYFSYYVTPVGLQFYLFFVLAQLLLLLLFIFIVAVVHFSIYLVSNIFVCFFFCNKRLIRY